MGRRGKGWFERVGGLPALGVVGSFVGSSAIFMWNISNNVATRPYVDDRFTEAKQYTDSKAVIASRDIEQLRKDAEQIRSDAFAHSDTNKQLIMIEVGKIQAENRETMARTSTTLELLVRAVQGMRDEAYEFTKRKKSNR